MIFIRLQEEQEGSKEEEEFLVQEKKKIVIRKGNGLVPKSWRCMTYKLFSSKYKLIFIIVVIFDHYHQ